MQIKKIIEKISLLALTFSGLVFGAIGKVFAANNVTNGWNEGLNAADDFGLPNATVYEIVTNILSWLLTIVGVVGVIGFAIAGIMYLTSTGEEAKIKTAKSAMVNSIIGVIVAICGVVVLLAVDTMLNAGGPF
jgi:cytochrome bd-type quinol oxidase subunit 2